MRIGAVSGSTVGQVARRAANTVAPEAESRALIAIDAPASAERSFTHHSRHPSAPFLAHLIATQMQAPQTRARRRAEPGEAISVYAAMVARKLG